MTTHFHIGHNMPGCLPESGPHCTNGDSGWAMHIWHGEVHAAADSLSDDGDFLTIDTAQALMDTSELDAFGSLSIEVDGYVYWVESAEGTFQECELARDNSAN